MARNKKQQRKRRNQRRRTTTRRKPNSASQGSSGIGRIIASGVKGLLTSVPAVGPALGKIADMTFHALGLTTQKPVRAGDLYTFSAVENAALAARVQISLGTIVSGSKSAIQLEAGEKFMCNYRDGRLIRLNISVQPTNPLGKRAGEWTLAYQPFFSEGDESDAAFFNTSYPLDPIMHKMYLSATGSASRPLGLTYRPRPCDGRAYHFSRIDAVIGEVTIRFDQPVRPSYGEFAADDFSCDVVVSGTVELRGSPSTVQTSGAFVFTKTEADMLRAVGTFVYDVERKKMYTLMPGFTCVPGDRDCSVSGQVRRIEGASELPTLDSMAI